MSVDDELFALCRLGRYALLRWAPGQVGLGPCALDRKPLEDRRCWVLSEAVRVRKH